MERLEHAAGGFRDELACELIIGKVQQVRLSERNSVLVMTSEDKKGEPLQEVAFMNDLIKGTDPRDMEGSRVIFGMTHKYTLAHDSVGGGMSWNTFFVLHFLDGPLSGKTLTHRSKSG